MKHSTLEFVRGIHRFWSHFKNGVRSTHIHVSAKHLHKYLGEFSFRFNARHAPGWMF